MPSTFEAVVVFAAAIAPGYAFLSGFQHQRSHTAPERDLYVLAQSFVLSAVWVAVTWWPAGHLVSGWVEADVLRSHEFVIWLIACGYIALPYILGRLVGLCLRLAEQRRQGWVFRLLESLGAFEPPSLWEWTWSKTISRGPALVVIQLKDGRTLEGQFASKSKADLSPRKPRLYLEKAYGRDGEGKRVSYPEGAYIEGEQIAGVQFKT